MAKAYHELWILLLQTKRVEVQLPSETRDMMAYLFQLISQRRDDIVRRLQIKRTSTSLLLWKENRRIDTVQKNKDMVRMALLPIIAIDTRLRVLFRKELAAMCPLSVLLPTINAF